MCGIVGVYNREGPSADPSTLRNMVEVQRHRGPDSRGARFFSLTRGESAPWDLESPPPQGRFEAAVGFNRLSILDLTPSGDQPMANEDGSVFVVFNGEIYNAFDWKPELEAAGFRFRGRSDTEVILRLYEHLGFEKTLERLNGMFALCIVDLRTRELWLARDRLGIKPLYWAEAGGALLFSSEVKSFLRHPEFRAELAADRLDEYFTFRYCSGDGFLLKGVHQLEAGHWMRVTGQGQTQHRFWEVPCAARSQLSCEDGIARLETELQRSVAQRLLSDVKVGCQLSGGVDSSIVNVFATRRAGADMDAFSIVFDDPRFSEEPWIDVAAATAGVRSHKFTMEPSYLVDHLGLATWYLDQPVNHPNSVGIYFLAENASRFVTVLLSGEGADELLGGYTRFYYAALRPRLRRMLPLLNAIPRVGSSFQRVFGESRDDPRDWFVAQTAYMPAARLAEIRPDADRAAVLAARRARFDRGDGCYLERCFKYELETHLVDLLVRQDKMTMAHAMENRVPFLDHQLVEFVRSLPTSHMVSTSVGRGDVRMLNTKTNLKRLAGKYFDDSFVYRRKIGFDFPLASYFGDASFRPLMEEALLPGMRSRGVVDAGRVESWWRTVCDGDGSPADPLWICVAFEIWAQQFLDGREPTVPAPRRPRAAPPTPQGTTTR